MYAQKIGCANFLRIFFKIKGVEGEEVFFSDYCPRVDIGTVNVMIFGYEVING